MPATVTEIGSSNVSANPASTITVTTTAEVSASEILFFLFCVNSATSTTPTATATAGGANMTQDGVSSRGVGTTSPNGFLFRYEPTGGGLATGATVTATVTNGGTGSAALCIKVGGLVTGLGLRTTIGTANGLSQSPSTGNSGTPVASDEIFSLAILAAEVATGGQAGAPSNAYTALTEVIQTTRSTDLVSAWKDIPPAAGVQNVSWTPSWGANKNWAGLVALYLVNPYSFAPNRMPLGV